MKLPTTILLLFWLLLPACTENVSTDPPIEEVESTFRDLMQEAMDNSFEVISGVSMSVIAPDLDIEWSEAVGLDSAKDGDSLKVEQPFRIASVTKTFVAAAILRLHEMDSLSIDDPISQYISAEHLTLLEGDGYDMDAIQIVHCLNHTSGLFDFAMGSRAYIEKSKSEPNKRWTRTEQLEGAVEWGGKLGVPGEQYVYSDTGYILLGEIVEKFFGGDLAKGLRELLKFEALGMNSTWLETLEDAPSNVPSSVHRYIGKEDFSVWDASIDLYGGGGLMSTCPDLAIFFQALFNHRVFTQQETLDLMLYTEANLGEDYQPLENRNHKDYRLGLWKINIYGEEAFLHKGLWGTILLHIPAYNSSFAVNFTRGWSDRMLKKAILVVKNNVKNIE